jgi:hypothetical protein
MKILKDSVKNMVRKMTKCKCGKQAAYFHSKCCNAHFEGIFEDGDPVIVCEKCGKYVGNLVIRRGKND